MTDKELREHTISIVKEAINEAINHEDVAYYNDRIDDELIPTIKADRERAVLEARIRTLDCFELSNDQFIVLKALRYQLAELTKENKK